MPTLADIQSLVRDAVIAGETGALEPLLSGGGKALARLEIHRRNYQVSLLNALLQKFPASAWLAGASFLSKAAMIYVRRHPPDAPRAGLWPRLISAPDDQVAIAVDEPCLAPDALSAIATEVLPDLTLSFQLGVRYLAADWPVDDLIRLYLANSAPEYLTFEPAAVWLEIRGARGEFSLTRLPPGEFLFRQSIREGNSIGAAVECAMDADTNFDPGTAMASLLASGLVTGIGQDNQE